MIFRLLCNLGWYVHNPDVQNKCEKHTHTPIMMISGSINSVSKLQSGNIVCEGKMSFMEFDWVPNDIILFYLLLDTDSVYLI